MKNPRLLILLVASVMILYYGRIDISKPPHSEIPDIQNYRLMALATPGFDEAVSRNFGYRILLPYTAGLMPFDIDTNFYIMAVILSLILPLVFFRFLCEYGLKEDTSFFLTVLFITGRYTFGFAVWDFYDVHDLFTYILIPLFLISLKHGRFLWMALILLIGTANRETILFLVPSALFYYAFLKKNRVSALKMTAAVIPAAAVLVFLRSFIITEQTVERTLFYSVGRLRFDESGKLFDPVTYYRIINTFIPLTIIPFVFWKDTKDFFKKNLHFLILILVYYSSCFLAGDTERLIVPMFPVFYLLTGIIFEKYNFTELKGRILVLTACVLTIPHHIYFRYKLPHRDWKVAVSLITLIFVTYYFYRFKKAKNVLGGNSDI